MIQNDNDQIKSVWTQCVSTLEKNQISQLKCYSNPPAKAIIIGTAIANIFGYINHLNDKNSWCYFKKCIGDPNFCKNLLAYNVTKFNIEKLPQLEYFLKQHELNTYDSNNRVKFQDVGAAKLHIWLLKLIQEVKIINI